MKQKKIFILNRKKQKICVLIEETPKPKGLVFIMHGLGGFKEQEQIQACAEAFLDEGFTSIRFDTTNTLGESDGKYENATLTNYYEDLEDVITWAQRQTWYKEPFWLVGHSLGGFSIALYAAKYPRKIKSIVPISPVVSGKLSLEGYSQKELKEWETTGYRVEESISKPGVIKKLNWNHHIQDRLKYNLLEKADKLTMPVLIIVGKNDTTTPPKHRKLLYEKLPGKKELHIIKGASHTFREQNHLEEIKTILKNWIIKNS